MDAIKIGDRILSSDRGGNFSFSPVLLLPQGPNKTPTTFIKITTRSGKTVWMTRGHLLPLAKTGTIVPAKSLATGQVLRTAHGDETLVGIKEVILEGAYTAVTEMEFIVVSGIVASPFSSTAGVAHTSKIEAWCSSNPWLALKGKAKGVADRGFPNAECLSLVAKLYKNS